MSTLKQNLVEYSTILQKEKGTSKTDNLKNMFPGSPIYKGDISDNERLEFFQNLLNLDNIDNDTLHAAGGYYGIPNFDMNYLNNGLPLIKDVKTGGGGLPASPYAPNPVSPGPGSTTAANQPAYEGEIKNITTISNFGSGLGGLAEPTITAKNIGTQKIGEYVSGRSYQGSDGNS